MLRLLILTLLLTGCSRAKLEQVPPDPPPPRDDKIDIEGEFCTRSPGELAFPLRVLFIVDTSDSMEVTDPPDEETGESSRVAAVRATWTRLLDESPFAKIGIMLFSANARSRTTVFGDNELPVSYFTNDVEQLEAATLALQETERTTNYLNALDEAYFEIRTEMLRTDEEQRARSRFAVIFLSDGLPDDGGASGRNRQNDSISSSIRRMKDLAKVFGVRELTLHTAYMSSDTGSLADAPAKALLQRMAEAGEGTFRSFASGETLDFLHIDLSAIKRLFTLASLVAFNTQMVRDKSQIPKRGIPWLDNEAYKDVDANGQIDCVDPLIDSDADGLADLIEGRIGTDPLDPDTDGDGLRDRVEWGLAISGLDPLDPTDAGCFSPERADAMPDGCTDEDGDGFCDCEKDADGRCIYSDKDGDGLRDCEEIFLGTSQNSVDTDIDGIPDPVEYRFRTDTVSADYIGDLDWDLTPNGVELRTGGNPLCDDANVRSKVAYNYLIEELGVRDDQSCYRFDISGITLLPTLQASTRNNLGQGKNRVMIFAGEQSFDEPETYAGWRIACVEGSYAVEGDRKTPIGRVRLADEDFVPSETFDPAVHCETR